MITGSALLDMFVVFSGSNDHSVMITPWCWEESRGKRLVFDSSFMLFHLLISSHIVLLVRVYGTSKRKEYYAIWTLIAGASILTGYGFIGYHSTTGKLTERNSLCATLGRRVSKQLQRFVGFVE